ncbi:MAG: nucleotidyltransferase family protein, partial [Spirochaetales bacterium]|nr:nucleotidyltransferase family protein [Spirochaetales bacterium]
MPDRPAAVVLCAGYSSRMSRFKPLYPLGKELLIQRVIRTLREGGVERIFAVTGFEADLLEPKLKEQGVTPLYNENFDQGMYSSIQTAVRHMPDSVPGFLLLPVDYPFILPQTIASLVKTFMDSSTDVVFPVYQGRKGHPPVIGRSLFRDILEDRGEKGLRGVLNRSRYLHEYRETGDEAILYDADDDATLAELKEK